MFKCSALSGFSNTITSFLPSEPPDICEEFKFDGNGSNLDCDPNILNVARANPNLSAIVSLIEAAGLEEIFERCSGPFTLLLPDNAAVEALGSDTLEALLKPKNIDILQDLLFYHTVPGLIPSSNLEEGPLGTLFAPADVLVFLDPIMFNSANALSLDTSGCNGLYDMIDEVLVPGTLLASNAEIRSAYLPLANTRFSRQTIQALCPRLRRQQSLLLLINSAHSSTLVAPLIQTSPTFSKSLEKICSSV